MVQWRVDSYALYRQLEQRFDGEIPDRPRHMALAGGAAAFEAALAQADSRCGPVSSRPWCNPTLSPDARAGLLLSALSSSERISLLGGDDNDDTVFCRGLLHDAGGAQNAGCISHRGAAKLHYDLFHDCLNLSSMFRSWAKIKSPPSVVSGGGLFGTLLLLISAIEPFARSTWMCLYLWMLLSSPWPASGSW